MEPVAADQISFWERLIQPHPAVRGEKRRAVVRVLAAFMLGLTLLSLLLSVVYFLISRDVAVDSWFSVALFFTAYLLSRGPRPVLSELLIVIGLTGIINVILINGGPSASAQGLAWIIVPVVLGVVLLPMRAAIVVTLINIGLPFTLTFSGSELEPAVTSTLLLVLIFTSIIALATKYARERDLQKLEQQALALDRSRARYQQLFDDVPIGLFESTPGGQISQANPALLQIFGFRDIQALQAVAAVDLYVNPADRHQWRAILQEKGSLQDFEIELKRADGQRIWVREHVRTVIDQEGEVSHFRGSMEDVTERRRLQSELAEQHQALRMIIGAMPNVLLVVDEQNHITALYMPSDFPPLLNQSSTASMEKLVEVLPPELAAKVLASIRLVRQSGGRHSFEQQAGSADEQISTYLRVKTSAVTETGDILIVVDDITEIKKAEEAVHAYAAELELRNAELDAFGQTVAHDLRRPLNHIVGYADLIKQIGKGELSPQSSKFLTRIEDAAFNMGEMIHGLLMLSQLRDAAGVVEAVDMSAVIGAAIKKAQPDIEQRGVRVDVLEPIPDALGYAPWLEEVFANLISNAVKYIGQANDDPTITLRATIQAGCARYEVVDNGLGIAAKDQPALFELLTRFHPNDAGGTGLGLSIVQRIVTKLGGAVGVESEPGLGSTFWFTLPPSP